MERQLISAVAQRETMTEAPYVGIYDFQLFPYSLGDVLTWNVQTAVRSIDAGRSQVDIYICADPRYPAGVFQRASIVAENAFLYLNEMLGAFGTHPCLGNIHVYMSRDQLVERLEITARGDAVVKTAVDEYEATLRSGDDSVKKEYFSQTISSHAKINEHYARHGGIPLLGPCRGCEPDVEGVMTRLLGGKRVVIVHPRLRRLDHGLGSERSQDRDSDFLEWYEFLRGAAVTHPDAQFVVVGRLQEKPLELLRLSNVTSLRALGLGLGHELTLLRRADLFIGTSSGFAAMANFSETPYFVTRLTKYSYFAYGVPNGSPSLPFAAPNQILVRETETAALLANLLDQGLSLPSRGAPPSGLTRPTEIDPNKFSRSRDQWLSVNAMTSRYFTDDDYADQETAFLVAPHVAKGNEAVSIGDVTKAAEIARRVSENFPRLSQRYPQLRALADPLAPPLMSRLLARARRPFRELAARALGWLPSAFRAVSPKALHRVVTMIHGTFVDDLLRKMKG
jgi:hypothetical protein